MVDLAYRTAQQDENEARLLLDSRFFDTMPAFLDMKGDEWLAVVSSTKPAIEEIRKECKP